VRYPRGSVKDSLECDYKNFNPFENEVLKEGKDLTIVTHGRMTQEALKAANRAEKDGVNCEVIYMRCIKPLDLSFIIKSSNKTGHLLIIDESLEDTSIKDRISVKIYKENKNINIDYLTLPNKFIEHGTVEDILDRYQLSEKGIYEKIMSLK
jgi:transketolase C-terminal domain/subunit